MGFKQRKLTSRIRCAPLTDISEGGPFRILTLLKRDYRNYYGRN